MKKQNYFKTIFLLLLFSINLSAQVPAYVPTNGLIAWWPFTGNANDLSGNGNNGTNYGATLTTDRFSNSNSAYSFNGTSNYIQAPNYALQGSITFSGWYKMPTFAIVQPDAIFFSNQSPLQASGSSNAVFGWRSSLGQNGHAAYLRSPFTGYYPINQQVPSVNVWHHFVVVFDNGVSVKMYLDNNLIYTNNSVVNNFSLPSFPMLIGNAGSLFYFLGQLDDIGIWNRALTSCEINQLYTASTISVVASNSLICAGQNATISVSGANSYTWSNSSNSSSIVVSPSLTSTYSVAGTTSASCTSTSAITLSVNPNPTITVNNGTICSGQNFTINPNGANTYTIQGGIAVVSPSINSTYTVIGTSAAGCISQAFVTSSLTVNPNPIITVNNGTICAGQNFTINPNGANTYTIQGGNAVVSPTSNTNYTVVGTSTAGCVSQAVATSSLIVNASPTVTVNSGAICIGESFTISPNGANTYTIQGANAVVSPSINTNYTVVGTSTAGCLSQAFATSSLTVNLCVGINNQNMGLGGVSIYPNPNNGEFTIELVSLNNTYITITNVLGQIIKEQKAELINQINLNLFEKGIYFINVMENNQSVYRGSIIKE